MSDKTPTEVLEAVALACDKTLLGWVTNGVPLIDAQGDPILTKKKKQAYRPLSGAEMQAVIRRITACGIKVPGMGGSAIEQAAEELAKQDESREPFKFPKGLPPMTDGEDAATA